MPNRVSQVVILLSFSSERFFRSMVLMVAVTAFCFLNISSATFERANSCVAQTQPAATETQPDSFDLKKALKYHSALLRRPNPGYLYDRFYNSWMDASSLEDLKKFLVKQANDPKAKTADRLLLAFFYAKQGKDIEALQQFGVALKDNPDNFITLYEMAIIQARTHDYESALSNLRKAANTNPSPAEGIKVALLRGKLLARNLQTDEAAKVWDELTKDNPDDLGLMEDLIELQITEGMLKQAEALSDRLIAKSKDPFQKVIRQLRKGDILQRGGSREQALKAYDDTLAQVGMNTWVEREILGRVEQRFRREDDLIGLAEHLEELTEANSIRVAIRKNHAKVLMELGEDDEAIEVYEKIIELTPGKSRESRGVYELVDPSEQDRSRN